MHKPHLHVVPYGSDWKIKREGNEKAIATFKTQKEAFEKAREMAKVEKCDVMIHGKNGKIRERYSYAD
jgi:hypothetical protein